MNGTKCKIHAFYKYIALSIAILLCTITIPIAAKSTTATDYTIYLPILSKSYSLTPVPGLRIAYSSQWSGELMQYDVDTGTMTQLLPQHFMSEGCWKFSPDITSPRLLYLLDNTSTGNIDVKIKYHFGANTIVTLPNVYRNSCANYWHPSGKVIIAYNIDTETYDLLYPTGVKLTSFWGDLGWKAAFSPDGNRVVFVSPYRSNILRFFDIEKDGNGNITGISQDPSDFVEVDIGDHFIADIEWSPDGSKLAIIIENNWDLEDADILLIQPDGAVLSNLTNGFNKQNGKNQNYQGFQWSPTQEKLAFWVYNLDNNTYVDPEVFVIDLLTGRIIELTGGEYSIGETPSFSPDGNKLIFTTGPQFGHTIVMCNPDGSVKVPLPIEASAFNTTFRP